MLGKAALRVSTPRRLFASERPTSSITLLQLWIVVTQRRTLLNLTFPCPPVSQLPRGQASWLPPFSASEDRGLVRGSALLLPTTSVIRMDVRPTFQRTCLMQRNPSSSPPSLAVRWPKSFAEKSGLGALSRSPLRKCRRKPVLQRGKDRSHRNHLEPRRCLQCRSG